MARTPLLSALQRMFAELSVSARTGLPVDVVRHAQQQAAQRRSEARLSRRDLLIGAGAVVAASSLPYGLARAAASGPRVAIIGGGIAGLSAALTLADAGIAATIYEAHPNRVGGRMLSDRATAPGCGSCHTVGKNVSPSWINGQVTDVFGEMIDTNHSTMRDLAARFNIPLVDMLAAEPAGSSETYYFFGKHYPREQALLDFQPVYAAARADLRAAGYPTLYNSSKPGGRVLDNMSVWTWIETRVPGGHSSPMGMLLDVAYAIEYGADTVDQSALNLLYLLAYQPNPGAFQVFGISDERFRVSGGVDRITSAIANHLGYGQAIRLDHELEALTLQADGTYALSFSQGASKTTEIADVVLLTVPFPVLRSRVDLSKAGFDALKLKAIQELGAGRNGKLHLQFNKRLWNEVGPWGLSSGSGYADTGCQAFWETTRGDPASTAILCKYTGGTAAEAIALKHAYGDSSSAAVQADAQQFLKEIEPVFPGLGALWLGRCQESKAHLNPLFGASYAYLKVGQYQTICGYERVRQGNVFFAGEHCSQDFQGFMEGGASEGVRAAKEILAQLKTAGGGGKGGGPK